MLVWECLNCKLTMAGRGRPKECVRCRKGNAWLKLIHGVFNETLNPDRSTERECDERLPDQAA